MCLELLDHSIMIASIIHSDHLNFNETWGSIYNCQTSALLLLIPWKVNSGIKISSFCFIVYLVIDSFYCKYWFWNFRRINQLTLLIFHFFPYLQLFTFQISILTSHLSLVNSHLTLNFRLKIRSENSKLRIMKWEVKCKKKWKRNQEEKIEVWEMKIEIRKRDVRNIIENWAVSREKWDFISEEWIFIQSYAIDEIMILNKKRFRFLAKLI